MPITLPENAEILVETPEWEAGIYQIKTDDPVIGGPEGISNLHARQLANRTAYLKQLQETAAVALATHAAGTDHPLATTSAKGMTILSSVTEAVAGLIETKAVTPAGLSAALDSAVDAAVAALVGASPATLDTLSELAAALGNDPNFATTITNLIAAKAPLASPALTGTPTAPTPAAADNSTKLATTAFVRGEIAAIGTLSDQVARDQIALTNLRLTLNTAVSTGALVQGRQWEFATDEWGATSSDEIYVNAGSGVSYYTNAPGVTLISPAGATYFGTTTNNASAFDGTTAKAAGACATDGDGNGSATVGIIYPAFHAAAQYSLYGSTDQGFVNAANPALTITIAASTDTTNGTDGTWATIDTFATTDANALVVTRSLPGNAYKAYRATISGPTTNTYFAQLQFFTNPAPTNMVLQSPSVSVASSPVACSAYFLWKDVDSSGLTDFAVEVSRDGGNTWIAAAANWLTNSSETIGSSVFLPVRARAVFGAVPAGTALRMRVRTLNNKAQRIAAPAVYAE